MIWSPSKQIIDPRDIGDDVCRHCGKRKRGRFAPSNAGRYGYIPGVVKCGSPSCDKCQQVICTCPSTTNCNNDCCDEYLLTGSGFTSCGTCFNDDYIIGHNGCLYFVNEIPGAPRCSVTATFDISCVSTIPTCTNGGYGTTCVINSTPSSSCNRWWALVISYIVHPDSGAGEACVCFSAASITLIALKPEDGVLPRCPDGTYTVTQACANDVDSGECEDPGPTVCDTLESYFSGGSFEVTCNDAP